MWNEFFAWPAVSPGDEGNLVIALAANQRKGA